MHFVARSLLRIFAGFGDICKPAESHSIFGDFSRLAKLPHGAA